MITNLDYLFKIFTGHYTSNNQSKEKSKYRKGSKYDSWGRTHFGDTTWDSMSESQKDKYINDQKYYERIGQGVSAPAL
jgi:hypothetical protein